MKRVGIALAVGAVVVLIMACVVLIWPIHGNGVRGSALLPRYSDFGFVTEQPLPDHASTADLRRAGIRLPQDIVWHRRHVAFGLLAGAVAAGAVGSTLLIVKRRREANPRSTNAP